MPTKRKPTQLDRIEQMLLEMKHPAKVPEVDHKEPMKEEPLKVGDWVVPSERAYENWSIGEIKPGRIVGFQFDGEYLDLDGEYVATRVCCARECGASEYGDGERLQNVHLKAPLVALLGRRRVSILPGAQVADKRKLNTSKNI